MKLLRVLPPIEIFVEMSTHKINNLGKLMELIKKGLIEWKIKEKFKTPINLTIIPMNWKVEVGI
jgi:hypothetical protein